MVFLFLSLPELWDKISAVLVGVFIIFIAFNLPPQKKINIDQIPYIENKKNPNQNNNDIKIPELKIETEISPVYSTNQNFVDTPNIIPEPNTITPTETPITSPVQQPIPSPIQNPVEPIIKVKSSKRSSVRSSVNINKNSLVNKNEDTNKIIP